MIVIALLATFSLLTITGCSTIAGAGKDLQDVGGVIAHEAERAKKKI